VENNPRVSPDGNWVAYDSDESGETSEIYIQSFPNPGLKQQVSTAGGAMPRWSADGTELFYIAQDFSLMAVPVKRSGSSVEVGAPQSLFRTGASRINTYNVAPDGRFLMADANADPLANRISVILHWNSGLKK
jgi:Tol biopolymer transport system component